MNATPNGLNMQWNSASEFWAMGGYGLYVWGSFGLTALVMLVDMITTRIKRKKLERELRLKPLFDESAP